jgi:uncharacterized phage-associated protein
MSKEMAKDVRAIANLVLDIASEDGRSVSNLVINKVVFFLHAHHLVEFGEPLVSAKIEAWDLGPVFRELYKEFKKFGDRPITKKAQRINPETGAVEICTESVSPEMRAFLQQFTRKYLPLSPNALIALSHEKGGPWDQVWNHDTLSNASMSISDDLIKAWYQKAARH